MESTGVYWRPLYNLLEETPLEIWVVNARHIKAITTDYSHWQHGSFGLDR
jgi:transposase